MKHVCKALVRAKKLIGVACDMCCQAYCIRFIFTLFLLHQKVHLIASVDHNIALRAAGGPFKIMVTEFLCPYPLQCMSTIVLGVSFSRFFRRLAIF